MCAQGICQSSWLRRCPLASLSLLSAAIKVNHLFQLVFATAIILCAIRNTQLCGACHEFHRPVSFVLGAGSAGAHKHQIKLHCSYAALLRLAGRRAGTLHSFRNLFAFICQPKALVSPSGLMSAATRRSSPGFLELCGNLVG